jgi:hypothetical protein
MHVLLHRFYDAVSSGEPIPIPHADALRTTRVMDAVFESCRHGDSCQRLSVRGSAA